jgi:hypothetical protein
MYTIENYREFIRSKQHVNNDAGFNPSFVPDYLFDFQQNLVEWSVRKGRAAIFADCGLGKTICQLVWAENIVRHTNLPVLVLTPLAVAQQTAKEAEKFGIDCQRANNSDNVTSKIYVTNYEKLHHFDASKFAGVVCDESSILKNFEGATKAAITEFMRQMDYRLLCTATAAPNDYIELGTSSEAIGGLGYMDMLGMFFKNDQNSLHPSTCGRFNDAWYGSKWRFKAHAERDFWRWLCSWARACRKPSDLGFSDKNHKLPKLITNLTTVDASRPMPGMLFVVPAKGLSEQRQERKHTIDERCEAVAHKVSTGQPAVVWCHLNTEADMLERMIPGSRQVSGKDSDESKEEKFNAFASGDLRVLITKPKIGALGLNWQHCNHMTFFPSHSFEQYYQAVRRCWRFGQKRPVTVDLITTEGESDVMENLQRKAVAAERMFEAIVQEMNNELHINHETNFPRQEAVPTWL